MGNCARRLTGRGSEEPMVMSGTGPSDTADGTSNFHAGVEECNLSSMDEVALGDFNGVGFSMEPKSEYFSPRVEEMMRSKNQFSSPVEHEIEHSKSHWTQVSCPSDCSEDSEDNEERMRQYCEEADRENEEIFTELMNDPQWKHPERGDFFWKLPPHPESRPKLGRKIGEGGQAEIFEFLDSDGNLCPDFLLKVFKRGTHLSELKSQWPCGILVREVLCIVVFGWMLDDRRFAFVMMRCWGDLRKLIDQAMQEKNNRCPPFPYEWSGRTLHAKDIMRRIAYYMDVLHKQGIIHRDLKADNIFLVSNDKGYSVCVADFECSIGVLGTGFWRAPEILLALKNRSARNFSEKADVYSYGMTCFEIVTGRLPFETELKGGRPNPDVITAVIAGYRPKLPSDLDVPLKVLIERCWHPIPEERPSFPDIIQLLDWYCQPNMSSSRAEGSNVSSAVVEVVHEAPATAQAHSESHATGVTAQSVARGVQGGEEAIPRVEDVISGSL